jgi:hypothetical protein
VLVLHQISSDWCYESLRWANAISMCGVLVAISRRRLYRLRWFSAYVLLNVTVQCFGLIFGWQSPAYCRIYLWSRPLTMLLRSFVTWEVFAGLYRQFGGLKVLAQRAFTTSILVALAFASAAVPASRSTWNCPDFQCYFFVIVEAERFLSLGLAVFTIVMTLSLQRLSVVISPSAMAHALIWSARLTITATIYVIFLLDQDATFRKMCNIVMALAAISWNIAWISLVRKELITAGRDMEPDAFTGKLCSDLMIFRSVLDATTVKVSKTLIPRLFRP